MAALHGALILPTAPPGRFDAQLAEFKKALESRGLAAITIRSHINRIQNFLRWASERRNDLSLVSLPDVDDYLAGNREAGRRLITISSRRKSYWVLCGKLGSGQTSSILGSGFSSGDELLIGARISLAGFRGYPSRHFHSDYEGNGSGLSPSSRRVSMAHHSRPASIQRERTCSKS